MNKKGLYCYIFISITLSILIFTLGLDRKSHEENPTSVYQVYLNGKTIGVIKEEEELYTLIDNEQQHLKDEYNVNKIYAPLTLETTKVVTYKGETDEALDIYNKIKDVEPFTVKGYEITIAKSEDDIKTINVLKKEDFDTAIDNTIKAFVDEETYELYLLSKQPKITTTGSTIENIKLKESITIKEKYLSTEDTIFTDANSLSQYLLFGTTEPSGTHIVKAGENIKEIANNYQLSVRDFLLVNPEIVSEDALLFPGQEVNIGYISPVISVVVENTLVEDRVVAFTTEIKYDNKIVVGTSYTEQVGQNGLSRVTYYTETINGQVTQVINDNSKTVTITPAVTEIIVKGGLSSEYIGVEGIWAWPTLPTYFITSYFGWRTDPVFGGPEYHRGIDIAGTGHGSPIYAANAGTIIEKAYRWDMGYYLVIDHGDNIETMYMHLSRYADNLRVGTVVSRGEVIGYMGSTGKSTGTHLDFRLRKKVGYSYNYYDPLSLYTR